MVLPTIGQIQLEATGQGKLRYLLKGQSRLGKMEGSLEVKRQCLMQHMLASGLCGH